MSVSPSHLDALHQSAGEIIKVLVIKSADEPFEITMNDIVLTSMTLEEMTSDFEGAGPCGGILVDRSFETRLHLKGAEAEVWYRWNSGTGPVNLRVYDALTVLQHRGQMQPVLQQPVVNAFS